MSLAELIKYGAFPVRPQIRALRFPNTIAFACDSRNSAQYLDVPQLNKSNAGWMNWADGNLRALNKPLITLGNPAVSGLRSDEFTASVAQAIATGAAMVCLTGPVNDPTGAIPATFTASINASGVMAISSAVVNVVGVGGTITGVGTVANTVILSQLSGVKGAGGGATYQTNQNTVVPSAALTSTGYLSQPGSASAGITVTTANVVACMFANMKGLIKTINDSGAIAVLDWETGAGNYTAAMIGNLNDYHRLLPDFLQYGDGDGRGPPNTIVLDQTAQLLDTSSNGTIAFKPNNSLDTVHLAVPGARTKGPAAAAILSPYLRIVPGHRQRSLNQKSGQGLRNLIQTSGFTGSVAATGTGNSGFLPTNVTAVGCTGGATCVYSIQATAADADGDTWGNEVKMVVTGGGSLGIAKCAIAFDRTNITVGDFIRGGVDIDVSGASLLRGVSGNLEWFPSTGQTSPTFDMIESMLGYDAGGYSNFPLEPPPLFIPAFTGSPFTNFGIRAVVDPGGTVTVIFRKNWGERATR